MHEPAIAHSGNYGQTSYRISIPTIQLYCSQPCGGERWFDSQDNLYLTKGENSQHFINFSCRNCGKSKKQFAVDAFLAESRTCEIIKYGELWPFGPHTPAKVITLIGPDREYFLKGRRCENQGLGIGAFAYYRRVVENQKNRVLEEIINVSKKLGAADEMIADLEAAKIETQFSKAIESVKHGIPEVLLVSGHNPLTLLHSALSAGLHEQEDEECLAYCQEHSCGDDRSSGKNCASTKRREGNCRSHW